MKTFALDFETYYDREYSLRNMTPLEYILHPKFEVIGCAVVRSGFSTFMEEHQLRAFLTRAGKDIAIISHNASFDMSILAHRFGYVPKLMIDTLSMARATVQKELRSLALAKLAEHFGLEAKGTTVQNVIGMSKAAIKANGLWDAYADYSVHDAELAEQIYLKLMRDGFPPEELLTVDSVLRACVEPRFRLDANKLALHQHTIKARKEGLLAQCGMTTRDDLMSNEKFAAALRGLGVEPPTKISLATGKETYAFAKADPDFLELEEHEDPAVQALVAARLGVKSTLEETRTQRFINIANLWWPATRQQEKLMPVPLRYSGAHTHRLSGDWKLNLQNMPRGGALRSALMAPEGHTVVVGDSSQIEARLVGWFSGQDDLTADFAAGKDIYSSFASTVFGFEVNKKANPNERFVGKTAILGLGFGLGWPKFQKAIKVQSKNQLGVVIDLSDIEAKNVVDTYRGKFEMIPRRWRINDQRIAEMCRKDCHIVDGPVTFMHEKVRLPNGMFLYYHNLRREGDQWVFDYAGGKKFLYGGKLLENIIQALARICTMDAARRMRTKYKLHFAIQVHDELGYIVPAEDGDEVKGLLMEELCVRPTWAPSLPLAAEVEMGATYGDAK